MGDRSGARRVRIGNVPFLHAKPYEDVIVVEPDPDDGMLTWDSHGVSVRLGTRIEEDGGRWAMIVDYELTTYFAGSEGFSSSAR